LDPPQKERDSFGFEGTKGFLRFPPDITKKKDTTMVKPIAVSHGMVFTIETEPSPPHVCDGLFEGSIEGFYLII